MLFQVANSAASLCEHPLPTYLHPRSPVQTATEWVLGHADYHVENPERECDQVRGQCRTNPPCDVCGPVMHCQHTDEEEGMQP